MLTTLPHPVDWKSLVNFENQTKNSPSQLCRRIIRITAKILLSLLLIPLVFPSYYRWIQKSFVYHPKKEKLMLCTQLNFLKDENKKNRADYSKVKNKVEHLAPGPGFGKVLYIPGSYNLWMPGVAVAAHYLSDKNHIKGLYACQTLEAFHRKLQEIIDDPLDQRCAFILPSFSARQPLEPNTAQHKVTVCIEKKGSELHLALLDAMPLDNFNPSHCEIKENFWEKSDEGSYNVHELIFRVILKTSFDGIKSKNFYTSIQRREMSYGCESFALRDGLEFLQDQNFFKHIQPNPQHIDLKNGSKLQFIQALPLPFLRGVQSVNLLEHYQEQYPHLYEREDLKKSLAQLTQDYIIKINGNKQNHYMTWKSYKYNHLVIQAFKRLSSDQLTKIFRETLIA